MKTYITRRDKQCKKKSKKYKYLTKEVLRLYGAKNNKVKDFLHKTSKSLSSQYDIIFCEDLDLKIMSESEVNGLNRELRNS